MANLKDNYEAIRQAAQTATQTQWGGGSSSKNLQQRYNEAVGAANTAYKQYGGTNMASSYSATKQWQRDGSSDRWNNSINNLAAWDAEKGDVNQGRSYLEEASKSLEEVRAARIKDNGLSKQHSDYLAQAEEFLQNAIASTDNAINYRTSLDRQNAQAEKDSNKQAKRELQSQIAAKSAVSQFSPGVSQTDSDTSLDDLYRQYAKLDKRDKELDDIIKNSYATNDERNSILNQLKGKFSLGAMASNAMWGGEEEAKQLGQDLMAKDRLTQLDQELYNGQMAYGFGGKAEAAALSTLAGWGSGMAGNARALIEAGLENRDVDNAYGQQELYNTTNEEYQARLNQLSNATGIDWGNFDLAMKNSDEFWQNARDIAQETANSLGKEAQDELTAATAGLGPAGKFFVNMGVATGQIALDMMAGEATKLGSLAPMMARVFGESAQEAQTRGADIDTQLAFGTAKALTEGGTEKLFGIFDRVGYGKGVLSTGWEEKLVKKLTNGESKWAQIAVRALINAPEEMTEEIISSLLDPIWEAIITGKVGDLDPDEVFYSALMGLAMGFFGQATAVVTGQQSQANAELDQSTYDKMMTQVGPEAGLTSRESSIKSLYNRAQSALAAAQAEHPIPAESRLSRAELERAVNAGIITPEEASTIMRGESRTAPADSEEARLAREAGEPSSYPKEYNGKNVVAKEVGDMEYVLEEEEEEKKPKGPIAWLKQKRRDSYDKLRDSAAVRAAQNGFTGAIEDDLFTRGEEDRAPVEEPVEETPQNLQNSSPQTQDVEKGTQTPAEQETAVDTPSDELNSEEEGAELTRDELIDAIYDVALRESNAGTREKVSNSHFCKIVKRSLAAGEITAKQAREALEYVVGGRYAEKAVPEAYAPTQAKATASEQKATPAEQEQKEPEQKPVAEEPAPKPKQRQKVKAKAKQTETRESQYEQERQQLENDVNAEVARFKEAIKSIKYDDSPDEYAANVIDFIEDYDYDFKSYQKDALYKILGKNKPGEYDKASAQELDELLTEYIRANMIEEKLNSKGSEIYADSPQTINVEGQERIRNPAFRVTPGQKGEPGYADYVRQLWGSQCHAYYAESRLEIDLEKEILGIAGGKSPTAVLFVNRPFVVGQVGTCTQVKCTEPGKPPLRIILIDAHHPAYALGEHGTAVHEATHAAILQKFTDENGDTNQEAVYGAFEKFTGENQKLERDSMSLFITIAKSYYDGYEKKLGLPALDENSDTYIHDLYNAIKNNKEFAGCIANEFFAHAVSGTVDGAEDGINLDALQSATQEFLYNEGIVERGAFSKSPLASKVSEAYGKRKLTGKILKNLAAELQDTISSMDTASDLRFDGATVFKEVVPKPKAEIEAESKKKASQSDIRDKVYNKGSAANQIKNAKATASTADVNEGTFDSKKQEKVDKAANEMIDKHGAQAEYHKLIDKKEAWSVEEIAESQKIIVMMKNQLSRDLTRSKMGEDEYEERFTEIDALMQRHMQELSIHGQALRQAYKISLADRVRLRAQKAFMNWSPDGYTIAQYPSSAHYRIVDNMVSQVEKAVAADDVDALIDISQRVSKTRGNEKMLFGKVGMKMEESILHNLAKAGWTAEQIAPIVYGNINRICDDYNMVSAGEMMQQIRITNALSNFATGINNFLNNDATFVFNAIGHNVGYHMDKVLQKLGWSIGSKSGKKAIAKDKFIKGRNVRAEALAYQVAVLEAYYGVRGDNGRVDIRNTAKLNPNANWFERGVARYQFFVNAMVLAPDAIAKQRTMDSMTAGIEAEFAGKIGDAVEANKAELTRDALRERDRRTYQNDSEVSKFVEWFRDGLDKISKKFTFGKVKAGSFAILFAKVPANIAVMKVESTPIGALYQVMSYAYGVHEANRMHDAVKAGVPGAKEMSATKMAEYTRNLGRAVTTGGMVFVGAMLNAMGALKDLDREENEDIKKMLAAKGLTGLQFNLSVMGRLHDHEWREGDIIVGGGWLEVLATPLAIGAMAWEAKEDSNVASAMWNSTWKSFGDMFEAIEDIPGLQQAAQLYEGYTNAVVSEDTNNEMVERLTSALTQYAASSAALYAIPNLYSAAGAGLDNKMRDAYTADNNWDRALQIVQSRTAIARRNLPEKKDAFNESRTYGSNKAMGFLNKVVLPGDFIRYAPGKTQSEVMRLLKDGYTGIAPSTSAPRKLEIDGQKYELTAEERVRYRDARAKSVSAYYEEAMSSQYWENMADKERATVLNKLRLTAERECKAEFLASRGVKDGVTFEKWQTELKTTDQRVQFLLAKDRAADLYDDNKLENPADMDAYLKNEYRYLNQKQRDLLDNSYAWLDDMYDASTRGINASQWEQAHDIYKRYTEGKKNQATTSSMWAEFSKIPGINDSKLTYLEDNMKLYNISSVNTDRLRELGGAGLNPDKVETVSNTMAGLPVLSGHSGVLNNQKYEAIAKMSGLSEREKWETFLIYATNAAIKKAKRYWDQRDAHGYTFAECLHKAGLDTYK